MNVIKSSTKLLAAVLCGTALVGCNAVETADESPVIDRPASTVVINGSVSGLSATRPVELTVVTTNNGINDGSKVVSVRGTNVLRFGSVATGANYTITVTKSPFGRTCTIANGTGTATADVDNVTVTCVRSSAPRYTLTASIASGLAAAPPAGFAVTLTTEEGTETIHPAAGQTSVAFTLPILYPSGDNPPPFNYAVTATNTVGGTTNTCAVTSGTGALITEPAAPASPNVTNVTVSGCFFTITAAVTYSAPPGGTDSAMGTGGVQLGVRNQLTGAVVAQAPLINSYSATAVAIPGPATGGTWVSNSSALYEVVVQSNPANQFCIVQGGGMAELVTAAVNVAVQVRCRDVPVSGNQLKGVYQLQPRTINDAGAPITLLEPTRNFLTFFPNGTFIYGTHHATATAGVEHGFYNYAPGAGTLGFTVWTDTNGGMTVTPVTYTSFAPDFLSGSGTGTTAIDWTGGLSGRSGYTMSFTQSFVPPYAVTPILPGNVTATNVVKTAGSVGTPGTLSMQFGAFAPVPPPAAPPPAPPPTPANLNNVLNFVEPVNTLGQIEGTWVTADSKQVFVYNKTTFYGFHAGVNGAPNLQDRCLNIDGGASQPTGFYVYRPGPDFFGTPTCMVATTDPVADAAAGRVAVGGVDVPNATTTNTTAPLIPGFAGRLPGTISTNVLSPSPVNYTVTLGTPDTLTIQNTLNDIPFGDPVVFKRATTF